MTYPNAKVVDLAKKFVMVKLDVGVEAAMKAAMKLKVEATPTLMFLNSKGKEVSRYVGFIPAATFAGHMETALKKAK